MSLKAKIEAVIYASEEPVTLAQLTGLLGEEGRAELETLAARQQELALREDSEGESAGDEDASDDEDALNAETLTLPGESVAPTEADAQEATVQAAAEAKTRERQLRDYFRTLLDELIADYSTGDRGLEIREVAGGFRLATKPEYHDAVRGFVKSLKPPLKLSLQALETLAVVAYKQPVTAPEISEIRGVDTGGVLGSLLARKLITTAGRKQVIGRPILYKTTKDFLLRFGLKDIHELPSIEEFEKMAGELNDAAQEEIPMDAPAHNRSEEAIVGEDEENFEDNSFEDNGRRAGDEPAEPVADEVLIDGRISGPPPNYADADDPSAQEAAIQSEQNEAGD